jgi:crotonobetainyl-CoA:carnitine CoA-transferase CaiB-like acyl-CoA transferase
MLKGITIIEVEGLGPAPFAGMMLADLGADVIVVNRKGSGGAVVPEGSVLDRGKRSIELDLKSAEDIQIFLRLVARADALIEGFRPGVMERLGIGPDDCMKTNPSLVFGRMTGWGQDGPLSHSAGHDLNYVSLSGAAHYASPAGEPPFTPPTLVGDIGGGALYLLVGVLAGILRARETGKGSVVDAAIVDGSANMMNLLMALKQAGGLSERRGESLLDGPHWSRSYLCACGRYISVQALEPKFYSVFLEKLGLLEDPDMASQHDMSAWPAQTAKLAAILGGNTRDHWAGVFEGTDACVAPVLSPAESAGHPHMNSRGVWHTDGIPMQAAAAPRFPGTVEWKLRESPRRGQHTGEILDWLETGKV